MGNPVRPLKMLGFSWSVTDSGDSIILLRMHVSIILMLLTVLRRLYLVLVGVCP